MGFSTPSLFAPSEHLIGGCRIGLCSITDSGRSLKPFKFV
ncbi:hypothetical protein PS706_03426 [Pseudomonas fluorescens]|jgi:hypothetical protein|nr:hypothetical protein PF1751_v1c20160 [Pseudomonas simiae]SFB33941.1 hypothetical protein SAMN05216248_104517 [Pseudomonas simiae]VVN89691.1 hypothetical protein PS708_01772 [Pseudomonas fluorescens]VVO10360.1 hypothetical protein PS706_03426 [Pseudomonas fluorescens]